MWKCDCVCQGTGPRQEDVHAHTHVRTHTRRLYGRAGNINGRQDADGLRASWLAEKLVCVCVFKCVFV